MDGAKSGLYKAGAMEEEAAAVEERTGKISSSRSSEASNEALSS